MSTGGYSVRGRRRGRPPGVRSSRSGANNNHVPAKRQKLQQQPDHSHKAHILAQKNVSDENEMASEPEDSENSSSSNSEQSTVPKAAPVSGRRRGRPPRRIGNVAASVGRENIRAINTKNHKPAFPKRSVAGESPRVGSPGPHGTTTNNTLAHSASVVVDPMVFVQNTISQGYDLSSADENKLAEYLCSSVTLLDDTVLSALPKCKSIIAKRDPNAMTLPMAANANRKDADKELVNKKYSKRDLEKEMRRKLSEWIESMAATMNRISLLRRQGLLRDSVSFANQYIEAHAAPQTQIIATPTTALPENFGSQVTNPAVLPLLPPPLPEPAQRSKGPPRVKTSWDQLLADVVDRQKEITMTSRRRKVILRKCSKLIEKENEEKMAKMGIFKNPEQAKRAEREQKKRLAKWIVQQVMKKWMYVESIFSEQRQVEEEEEKSKQDKRILFDMLQRSTQLLEGQRTVDRSSISGSSASSDSASSDSASSDSASSADGGAAKSIGSQADNNSGSDSKESNEHASGIRDLIAGQSVDIEELRRRYFGGQHITADDNKRRTQSGAPEEDAEVLDSTSSTSDSEAVISPEQSDAEFTSESSDQNDSDNEMAELQRDQDVPIGTLLEQYCQRNQTERLHNVEEDSEEEHSQKNVKADNEATGIKGLASIEEKHTVEQPFLLRGSLRIYQRQGLDWLASLHQHRINGILADEMGLGKTIQTIALLAHLACAKGIWGPHLVIVPTSVLLNWEQEFHRWLPGFKVVSYYGGRAERKLKRKGWSKQNAFHVCITSYQLAIQDSSVFKRKPWYYMILDEAQAIKNFRSQRWQTLLGFRSASRLLLTGTPLQNSLVELWSLMYFLMPEQLGIGDDNGGDGDNIGFAGLEHFREWFSQPLEKLLAAQPEIAVPIGSGDNGNVAFNTSTFLQGSGVLSSQEGSTPLCSTQTEAQMAVQKLHTVLRPHILRRLKQDVETQLPNKIEHVVYCHLSKRQRFLYDDFMSRSQTRKALQSGTYLSVMGCLMQLRKVCNHPDLFETRPIVTSWVMSGANIASYRHTEGLVRRMLQASSNKALDSSIKMPWQEESCGRMSSWGMRGLVLTGNEHRHDRMAWENAKKLDATPGIVRQGLVQAKTGLDIIATEEKSWDELQLHPIESRRYTCIEANMLYQKQLRASRSQEAWMRLAEQNNTRINGLAFCPIYGASTLHACRFVPSLRDRLGNMATYLVLTGKQRLEKYESTITNFVFMTPPVVVANSGSDVEAVYPHLRPVPEIEDHGLSWASRERQPTILSMRRRVTHHTGPMRPVEVRQQIAFPEPFLLQYDCGKLQALEQLLGRLVREGHRALLFTQMTKVLDILEKWLNLHGYRYLRLDGATKVEQRWRLTERFNHDSKWKVFISSTRAGGLGINLTGADTVIFYDSDWNHAMDAQCQDRCHRIGQQREVNIYRLISENTIEEAIWRKQCEKRWLNQIVIQEGQFDPNARKNAHKEAETSEKTQQQPWAAQPQDNGAAALGVSDWYDLASTVLAQSGGNSSVKRSAADTTNKQSSQLISEREAVRLLSAAEDEVDATALRVAITEVAHADALDLGNETAFGHGSDLHSADHNSDAQAQPKSTDGYGLDQPLSSVADGQNAREYGDADEDEAGEDEIGHIDDYMLRFLMETVFN
ncbi:swr1 complex component [Coemansia spiralis]|uniref:Swr1 complex component n=2 Tax=Coemansia TaxID=4863 RepID=A0A9W8G4W4_9FUNG|nr:swr1 complex component [Coemansia sp. RSA 1358]KAJ2674783.1 swr1 complex component [Coemansia spiralis]